MAGVIEKRIKKSGFTLVELAIVIVIIGLITGGVLGAQSLIKSANRQSTINTIFEMDRAVRAFELEYDNWPGKLENAYDYFGSACGSVVGACHSADNDKCIDSRTGMCHSSNNKYDGDIRLIYVHLALSEIAPDLNYITNVGVSDKNCVQSTLNEAPIGGHHIFSSRRTQGRLFLHFANMIYTGTQGGSCTYTTSTAYTPETVKSIDEKIDNGNAVTGKITSQYYWRDPMNMGYLSPDCHDDSGVYNVANKEKDCGFSFQLK